MEKDCFCMFLHAPRSNILNLCGQSVREIDLTALAPWLWLTCSPNGITAIYITWKSLRQKTIPWYTSISPTFLYTLGISIIYYSIIKEKSRYKSTRYKAISSLISGSIRCEVRNEGSHNGRFPSKKSGCESHNRLSSYTILFFFETLSESLHNRIEEVSHNWLLSDFHFHWTW